MIWGAVGLAFKPNLVIVDGNIDSEAYISMLKKHLIPVAYKHYGKGNYRLQ
jgi:hypothetical protein